MAPATLRAQIADFLGGDLDELEAERSRPELATAASSLQPGQVAPAQDRGQPVAVARSRAGHLYVLPDRCPHDGGLLSDGFIDGETIVCARHGWEFALETGESPGGIRAQIACRSVVCPRRRPRDS